MSNQYDQWVLDHDKFDSYPFSACLTTYYGQSHTAQQNIRSWGDSTFTSSAWYSVGNTFFFKNEADRTMFVIRWTGQ